MPAKQATVFSILTILLTKRRVSREYLAKRFSISTRTVSRYIDVLIYAGIPIETRVGVGGGIALADDYMIDKTVLSGAETKRIIEALEKSSEAFDDNFNTSISEKLEAVKKLHNDEKVTLDQQNVFIDCDDETPGVLKDKMYVFDKAISGLRTVEIKYTDAHGYETFREIDPYKIVFKAGSWYIYALCGLRGDFRLFKLSRINDYRMTSKRFTPIESRLEEKLELDFYNERYEEIEFEFFPTVRHEVAEWLGESAIKEVGTKLFASAELPYTDAVYKKILSFGSSIKVVAPSELVDKLKDEATQMLGIYTDK